MEHRDFNVPVECVFLSLDGLLFEFCMIEKSGRSSSALPKGVFISSEGVIIATIQSLTTVLYAVKQKGILITLVTALSLIILTSDVNAIMVSSLKPDSSSA